MNHTPLFTDDFSVFGILMIVLSLVFYTSSSDHPFWKRFYTIFPSLLMCYLIPAILSSLNVIAPEWFEADAAGNLVLDAENNPVKKSLSIYKVASRMLLPAALILLTISIDMKALFGLGNKALIMFLTGTAGVILGGPVAVLIVSLISPETLAGAGPDEVWRGLATIAGSWIGGGANQTAMLEIFKYNPDKFGAMVLVDIIVANIWMAALLYGIGKKEKIDQWLRADNSAIENLKEKVISYSESVTRITSVKDYMIILGITFGGVGLSYWSSALIPDALGSIFPAIAQKSGMLSTFSDPFFWLVTVSTIFGVVLSFTSFRSYEGAGASKLGSVFIYILVASIGMKMDLGAVLSNPGILLIGLIWMTFHAILLIVTAKWIKAPYFFLAVGSQANVGGAASAPVVASAFHPSLASVGVLLAIFGYIVGTYGAMISAGLMEIASKGI